MEGVIAKKNRCVEIIVNIAISKHLQGKVEGEIDYWIQWKCSKYQFVFVTVEVVLSNPFLFLAEKTASPFRTLTLRVFVIVLPVSI